ncbi:PH domain-containing protein [Myxococcus sp. RHSTA-1-4]|uniref:PH domain-containing protein n=1 Tax=Myxococcus sp. RHSTA-1-4 TaxID=2874601 RepID=UPI001CBBDD88|nr:PH domain-containing protein [Myxococcus sp. RHSTA-1-4]MBZ4416458.1 PH domain-containing protein [Myxococcus sp. RHSTA-1-4]
MGLFDRLIGHADVNAKSSYNLERFLGEGEKLIAVFRFARDEIAVTNNGVFTVDVQGIMGSKKEYKYFPLKGVKYVSYESAGTFDADADIKIGIDGNTELVNNMPVSKPLSFKIPKSQAAEGEKFFKLLKAALDA